MTDRFPILKLTKEAQKCVLTQLEIHERIAFSLFSAKAFHAIKSPVTRISGLDVSISSDVTIHPILSLIGHTLEFWKFQFDDNAVNGQPIPLAVPIRVKVWKNDGEMVQVLENIRLNLREWIHHFSMLGGENFKRIWNLEIKSARFDRGSIDNTFEGFEIQKLKLIGPVTVPSLTIEGLELTNYRVNDNY